MFYVDGTWEDGTHFACRVESFQELVEMRKRMLADPEKYTGFIVLRSGERVRAEDVPESEDT